MTPSPGVRATLYARRDLFNKSLSGDRHTWGIKVAMLRRFGKDVKLKLVKVLVSSARRLLRGMSCFFMSLSLPEMRQCHI